jgi:hypothetical protein
MRFGKTGSYRATGEGASTNVCGWAPVTRTRAARLAPARLPPPSATPAGLTITDALPHATPAGLTITDALPRAALAGFTIADAPTRAAPARRRALDAVLLREHVGVRATRPLYPLVADKVDIHHPISARARRRW